MAKHTFLTITAAISLTLLTSASCHMETDDTASSERGNYQIEASCGSFGTRSMYSGSDCDIHTICVWAYLDGKLDAEIFRQNKDGSWKDRDGNKADLSLRLYKNRQYHIYALANMGEQEWKAYIDEASLSEMEYSVTSYADLFSNGLPMCSDGAVRVFSENSGRNSIGIPLVRLVAKWTLTFAAGVNSSSTLTVRSVRLKNAASSVHPFARSKASGTIDGDCEKDLSVSISGSGKSTAQFFVLENMQGTAGGILSEEQKTAENLAKGGLNPELCTFIEIEGEHRYTDRPSSESVYTLDREMRYCYFLGDGTPGNCDLKRNTDYTSRFEFTDFGWTVDTYRTDVSQTLEDGTCYVTFCNAEGSPSDRRTISATAANDTISIYYKVVPDNLETIVRADVQDSHLRLLSSRNKVGDNLYRDIYANDYASRTGTTEMNFTISNAQKGISASAHYTFLDHEAELEVVSSKDLSDLYVAQECRLSAEGEFDRQSMEWSITEGHGIIEFGGYSKGTGSSCIRCLAPGTARIHVSDGNSGADIDINISKPIIRKAGNEDTIYLNLDGDSCQFPYEFRDSEGRLMEREDFCDFLYGSLLVPKLSVLQAEGRNHIGTDGNGIFISTLFSPVGSIDRISDKDARNAVLVGSAAPAQSPYYDIGSDCSLTVRALIPIVRLNALPVIDNKSHIGGSCPDSFPDIGTIMPNGNVLSIENNWGADVSLSGNTLSLRWPHDRNMRGSYPFSIVCRNRFDDKPLTISVSAIEVNEYLGITMRTVLYGGVWYLVPVAYDSDASRFPGPDVVKHYISWNQDTEFQERFSEIIQSERPSGLYQGQVDGALNMTLCERYIGTIRPAFSNGQTIEVDRYNFVSDEGSYENLSYAYCAEAYDIYGNTYPYSTEGTMIFRDMPDIADPHIILVDMTR